MSIRANGGTRTHDLSLECLGTPLAFVSIIVSESSFVKGFLESF